uniref:Uncharacterized protein n=1 Tax=Micrurus carvalhoi TaxID=3147026 RepID=A0A2H6N2K9_9SAUR
MQVPSNGNTPWEESSLHIITARTSRQCCLNTEASPSFNGRVRETNKQTNHPSQIEARFTCHSGGKKKIENIRASPSGFALIWKLLVLPSVDCLIALLDPGKGWEPTPGSGAVQTHQHVILSDHQLQSSYYVPEQVLHDVGVIGDAAFW